jgi:hypothetical protein
MRRNKSINKIIQILKIQGEHQVVREVVFPRSKAIWLASCNVDLIRNEK